MNGTVEYEGREYPVRILDLPRIGLVKVATELLASRLIGDDGLPVSLEAERVDNGIFYYVSDDLLDKSDEEISKHILESI